MTYQTPKALRMALEQRLMADSESSRVALDRLRRRVVFERIISRLQVAEPGEWVLKGGMALEVRLRDRARFTKDIDLGVRSEVTNSGELRERLVEALATDYDTDWFSFVVGPVKRLFEDGGGDPTWRVKVRAELAGRLFGVAQVDVSPRPGELEETELLPLPNSLEFAGVLTPQVEIIDIHRHAAEKFHAMAKSFRDRENTRVRDLVDLVILCEHKLLQSHTLRRAIEQVWTERDGKGPETVISPLPPTWSAAYELLAVDHDLEITSFPIAMTTVAALWAEMFTTEEA